jgi:fluoride ion exporter CrcB/FEX
VVDDPVRTQRATRILSWAIFAFIIAACIGTALIITATQGISPAKLRYLVPTGIFGGATTLVAVTISVGNLIKKRKERRASGK